MPQLRFGTDRSHVRQHHLVHGRILAPFAPRACVTVGVVEKLGRIGGEPRAKQLAIEYQHRSNERKGAVDPHERLSHPRHG